MMMLRYDECVPNLTFPDRDAVQTWAQLSDITSQTRIQIGHRSFDLCRSRRGVYFKVGGYPLRLQ